MKIDILNIELDGKIPHWLTPGQALPHANLLELYRKRIEIRHAAHDQTTVAEHRRRVHQIELDIFEAHRRHGRAALTFRRCAKCDLMHPASLRSCDGKGEYLFALHVAYGVDLILVVE